MRELTAEQEHLNLLYARLDALREEAAAALARGHATDVWRGEVARLATVEDGLCFGRLDLTGGRRVHIGRLGLFADDGEPLLLDWRAPAARPFYTATAAEPGEVVRRRRITTRGRSVVALDDELLDPDAPADGLVGAAALLAAVTAERTGRMRDIVTTLQAEQDRIVRDDARGVLVVQGGPGTGKTAVALHRVAYLLYTHEHLRTRGVLVLGPSRVFLDYIGQVLPGLGEHRVVTATVADLVPGVVVTRVDTDAEAVRKGRAEMAARLAERVRAAVRVPGHAVDVEFEQQVLRLEPAALRRAVRTARATGLPHNQARHVFHRAVVATLAGELAARLEAVVFTETGEALDGGSADGRLGEAELRALAAAGVVLGPEDDDGPRTVLDDGDREALQTALLADTGVRDVLDALWPPLTPAEVVEGPWSAADVPLLDEAAALVGASVPVFGHVVVDEAQELSEMDWRMLLRRCPSRSMTVVGDLAQTGSAAGATSWDRVPRPHRLAHLTVGYRTPREIMDAAARVLAVHHPALRPPTSVRAGGEPPWRRAADDVPGVLAELAGEHTGGKLAVIAPAAGDLAAALSLRRPPDPADDVVLLTPAEAKGLEFDAVVIADPAAVLAAGPHGPRDLYVAMTRATRSLGVVHPGPVPRELASLVERPVSSRRS
ncbi:HelD family protein [Amycolatopsis vancoresmycina]|uniref:Helicase n=1 Tax=Amycolatopsis vancoresmycina DSM 44592 TaxID=1292037 RepID=R1G1U6_9PSEU|nr:UvrD-helicase domain-containing protein [Amycolatopsis vancoresmycina]EOD65457.1 Helicase [Amycolatopsis vancoresmycina DSM 44592]